MNVFLTNKNWFLFTTAILIGVLTSCKEVGPKINLGPSDQLKDTTYTQTPATPQTKRILLEEFTGVQCTFCPAGHRIADGLATANPGKIVQLALHTSFDNDPVPTSTQDLKNADAQAIDNTFSITDIKPLGMVDRVPFGSGNIAEVRSAWTGHVNSRLPLTTPVNIELTSTYSATSNEAIVTVKVHYTQAVTDAQKLFVCVSESGIVTTQKDGSAWIENYEHKHVLRKFITSVNGDALSAENTAGRTYERQYKFKPVTPWVPSKMYVVSYVAKSGTSNEVLQSTETKLVP